MKSTVVRRLTQQHRAAGLLCGYPFLNLNFEFSNNAEKKDEKMRFFEQKETKRGFAFIYTFRCIFCKKK